MKRGIVLIALVLLGIGAPVFAQRRGRGVEIKMSSPVPANTEWGKKLVQLSKEWGAITGGEVQLKLFPNAVLGDEVTVIQQMDSGILDGAVLTSIGLNRITKKAQNIMTGRPATPSAAVITMSCPFLIRTEDELDLVLSTLKADLEARINEKGYFTLAWTRVGWAKIFSRDPVRTPADLRKQFVGTAPGEEELKTAFEAMGFKMRVVDQPQLLQALTTQMISAVYQSPIGAGGQQLVGVASCMLDLNIAPFMGGIVMTEKAWNEKIPDKYKAPLLEATRKVEQELHVAVKALEADVLNQIRTQMRGRFQVIVPTEAEKELWYSDIGRAVDRLKETTFDPAIYDKIVALLQKQRGGR